MSFIDLEDNFPTIERTYLVRISDHSLERKALARWVNGKGFELLDGGLVGEEHIFEWRNSPMVI